MKDRDFDGKLGAVAREIRTPAGVTWSALEELACVVAQRSGATDQDEKHVQEVLGMARLGVQRLLNLADRLSLMSQLDDSVLDLQRYHVDLREVVTEALTQARYLAGRKSVSAVSSLGDRSLIIHADARWLGAAILEICVNALRFAKSAMRVHFIGTPPVLLIEDDGPGFTPDMTSFGEGLGTSLKMATRVIAAHGGKLEQRPSTLPGRDGRLGAGFAISLPLRSATPMPGVPSPI